MNLETAANLGEALSGLAIMATLVFGLRQVMKSTEIDVMRFPGPCEITGESSFNEGSPPSES